MDIGVPFRDLGRVDVAAAVDRVRAIHDLEWTRNTFRQDVLADGAHAATRAILFRHEWVRWDNPWHVNTIEELIELWAAKKGIAAEPYLPVESAETDVGPVHTFAEWATYQDVLQPVVDAAIASLRTGRGIVTRLALVWLKPGAVIPPHDDGQILAHRAHRLHVPLLTPPGVEYKIGGKKLVMKHGHVYDFNNRLRHSVRHKGKQPRVNLFIDYYDDPGSYVPPQYSHY